MIDRNGRVKPNRYTRIPRGIAVVLAVAIIFLASGCYSGKKKSPDQNGKSSHPLAVNPENKKYLRTDEWVRMLALVLTYPDERASLWSSIPAQQRAKISYSDFVFYTTAIAKGLRAPILSFSEATASEKESFLRHITRAGIALEPNAEQSSFWWLYARTEDGRALRFAVAVTADKNGVPHFSNSWLGSMRAMYDYVELYTDAISRQSSAALASLIRQQVPLRSPAHRAAIENRTSAILEYYSRNITLKQNNLQFRALLPGYAVIEQQKTHSESSDSHVRTLSFQSANGVIRAEERIEETLRESDSELFFGDKKLFRLSEKAPRIRDEDTLPVLGIPLRLEHIEDANGIKVRFRVTWPGVTVEAAGTCNPETVTFDGVIRQVHCSYSDYRTGSLLKPGDSADELLLRYPFAQENGYRITFQDENIRQTFSVQVESGFVSQISIFHETLDK